MNDPKNPNADVAPGADSKESSLERAQSAFDRGDYRHSRVLSEALENSSDEQLREGAAKLIEQMGPNRLSLYLYGLTFAILCLVTLYAYVK